MNLNKMTPQWFVQGNTLRLSLHYWKPCETSSGYSGCSANWMRNLDEMDFVTAYNSIVDAAKTHFDLPDMKKFKVPKVDQPQSVNYVDHSNIVNLAIIGIAVLVGGVIGSIFF